MSSAYSLPVWNVTCCKEALLTFGHNSGVWVQARQANLACIYGDISRWIRI